jgi:RNA polymerase sigma-70 factor (ECF subfamily)
MSPDRIATRSRLVRRAVDRRLDRPDDDFRDFYLKEYAAVVGLAYALSGNRWLAEDLAQEAFLAAHRNWGRIAGYDQPGAWVRRVVANLSVSAFRRRVADAKALARLAVGQAEALPDLDAEDLEFWRAVRSLPRRQAQVVALHYLDDRPIDEIAEILGMASGTVKKHLFDGRGELARRLRLREDEA